MRIWLVALESGKRPLKITQIRTLHCRSEWLYIQHAMQSCMILKIESRPGYTITKGCCSSARETNKNKKVTFKVQQGLNFTVDVEFGFATMISVKQPEGKKTAYCVVFYDV